MPRTHTARRRTRRKRSSSAKQPARRRRTSRRRRRTLPGWGDLSKRSGGRKKRKASYLSQVSFPRFAGITFLVVLMLALYVGHVHATQDVLARVQEAREANQRLHLKHNRLNGAFNRATGPSVIYERAPELGLQEYLPAGPTLVIRNEQ